MSTLRILIHTIIIILKMKQLRPREGKQLAQRHTAGKEQSRDLIPGTLFRVWTLSQYIVHITYMNLHKQGCSKEELREDWVEPLKGEKRGGKIGHRPLPLVQGKVNQP